jgi:polyhydroxybutyrate depolymerase
MLGISGGGTLAHRLACEQTERFAAMVSLAGAITTEVENSCSPSRPIPILHFHGTLVSRVPYSDGSTFGIETIAVPTAIASWGNRNDADEEPMETLRTEEVICISYSGPANSAEASLCTVEGGGHTWPGGPELPGLTTRTVKTVDQSAKHR